MYVCLLTGAAADLAGLPGGVAEWCVIAPHPHHPHPSTQVLLSLPFTVIIRTPGPWRYRHISHRLYLFIHLSLDLALSFL